MPYKTTGFDLPYLDSQAKLSRVLSSALASRLGKIDTVAHHSNTYWDEIHFDLNKVTIFQDATPTEKTEILQLCSYGLLEEAYLIEKAGIGYMAKMVTLAESTEEKMLYALFSADEVTHMAQISPFLPNLKVGTDDPFLRLLEEVVESQDKTVLLFVLQVVLEGWGLSHYRSLAKDCCHRDLALIFQNFLQDESRHHATGVTLFQEMPCTQSSYAVIIETLALFLQMVQIGPQSVVAAIEKVKGYLSHLEKIQIFTQLDTQNHSGTRLNLLQQLMLNQNSGIIVEELQTRGVFQPLPPEKCIF